ncbi:MAG: Rne/Rng family ribonuclease [Flavobacteriales bacterium]|nr:Rne/Rng family ribonuclease [Flavobacteriales bacterium]
MNIELVINSTSRGVALALLHDKKLVELHHEQGNQDFAVGDIYLGKVRKVIPSLNAAFVDVGYEKDAFLHYLDLGPQFSSLGLYTKRTMRKSQKEAGLADFRTLPDIDKNGKIKDVVSSSQQIVVQVAKEPISQKGPRLTSEITLPGRYIVLVPFSNKISMSQRITSEEERTRLKRLMQSIRPKNFGIIIRTVAENKKVAELDADLRELMERWDKLYNNLKDAKPPQRILGELNKTNTVLRDVLTPNFAAIHVNDEGLAIEIRNYLKNIAPEKESILKVHKVKDLFDTMSVYRQIKSAFGKQVNLKSGAYLIVEQTEAMHVIDVNSGNRKGGVKNQEENALQTNLECAEEIARILRLRDMGGIICIDFIDMQNKANQKKLYEALKEAMKDDKAKHNILPPSKFGVIEITRQRVRPVTEIKTSEKCPSCNGKGTVQAPLLFTDEIQTALSHASEIGKKRLTLILHPMVEAYVTKGLWNSIARTWKKKFGMKLHVESSSDSEFLEYHLFDENGEEITV